MTREQVMNDVLLAHQPTKKFVEADEIGAMAVFLCRDEAQQYHRLRTGRVDGGWTAQ